MILYCICVRTAQRSNKLKLCSVLSLYVPSEDLCNFLYPLKSQENLFKEPNLARESRSGQPCSTVFSDALCLQTHIQLLKQTLQSLKEA